MIRVVREPDDMGLPYERCCMCNTPTPYWYFPNGDSFDDVSEGSTDEVACCVACAAAATSEAMPTKAGWCAEAVVWAPGRPCAEGPTT